MSPAKLTIIANKKLNIFLVEDDEPEVITAKLRYKNRMNHG